MERKPKFRSRKLDIRKPLAVYRFHEIPDLDENASVSRALPAVPTGVDKEEEEEHHLQVAITAAQLNTAPVYIPTPEATRKADDYEKLYKSNFKMPKNFIRFSMVIEDCVSVPYDMDDLDDDWLKNYNQGQGKDISVNITEDQFEILFHHLEKQAMEKGDTAVTTKDLEILKSMPYVSSVIEKSGEAVYEYWRVKRNAMGGKPLTPMTKPDEGPKSYSDPFVCFRRREIKGQRKTRRSDAQCLEKLRKLRSDLESARSLLEMVCKRDRLKRESLLLDYLIFEQTLIVDELRRSCDPAELEAIADLRPVFEKSPPKVFKKAKVLEAAEAAQNSISHSSSGMGQVGRPRLNAKEKAARAAARAARGSGDFTGTRLGAEDGTMAGTGEGGRQIGENVFPTQAILAHIEREVLKRKRLEEDFIDLSEFSSFPSPYHNCDLFFEQGFCNSSSSKVFEEDRDTRLIKDQRQSMSRGLFRRRIGRGGRLVYDRWRNDPPPQKQQLKGDGGKSIQVSTPKSSSVWSLIEENDYLSRQINGGFPVCEPIQESLYETQLHKPDNEYEARYVKLLTEPDLSRLNNAVVTNYNVHYMKVTSGISKPEIDYPKLIIQAPQINSLTSAMTNSMGSSIRPGSNLAGNSNNGGGGGAGSSGNGNNNRKPSTSSTAGGGTPSPAVKKKTSATKKASTISSIIDGGGSGGKGVIASSQSLSQNTSDVGGIQKPQSQVQINSQQQQLHVPSSPLATATPLVAASGTIASKTNQIITGRPGTPASATGLTAATATATTTSSSSQNQTTNSTPHKHATKDSSNDDMDID